jgi:hypothetical protein
MLVKSEFALEFDLPQDTTITGLLRLHPSLDPIVRAPETLLVEQQFQNGTTAPLPVEDFIDSFGNRASRFVGPWGRLKVSGSSLVEIEGAPDPIHVHAIQHPVEELPTDVLPFLLASRYC